MSVWLCIPSKRSPAEAEPVLQLWRERGYKIALWLDCGSPLIEADFVEVSDHYPGYGAAVNYLARRVIALNGAEWIVTGGDDVEPDLAHSAEEIALQARAYFASLHFEDDGRLPKETDLTMATFGVMQPTGDRWGDEEWSRQRWPDAPAYIDRICGSAWYGREYCRRMYGGRGPLCDDYLHMYVDEEAQEVAKRMGVLWQRRDLTQLHRHWGRKPGATAADVPEFLKHANSEAEWQRAKAIFDTRKANGFPGHEPIP